MSETFTLTVDGSPIAGTTWLPDDPRAVVVIHPATGVPAKMYRGFATHLARHGYIAVTYGYRGSGGDSGTARGLPGVRMRDWMDADVPAVADWARSRWPDLPHLAVGHSIGGHALALDRGSRDLAGFVTVASHAGVTRTVRTRAERARVWLLLSVLGPLLSRTMGVFPARRLGVGEDLPKAAMLEWGRWSRLPGYFFDDPTMDAERRARSVTTPVLAVGVTDDLWATPAQIEAITEHLTSTTVERRTWSPADAGVPAIGHMGFFRPAVADTLWPEVVAWLDQRAAEASS